MSLHEIHIEKFGRDPGAEDIAHDAKRMLDVDGLEISHSTVYRFEGISDTQLHVLGKPLHDPITEHVTYGPRTDWDNPNTVTVAPLPGSMIPEEGDLHTVANLYSIEPSAVSMVDEYRFGPSVSPSDRDRVVSNLLVNKTIQLVETHTPETLLRVNQRQGVQQIPIHDMPAESLMEISDERGLALDQAEMLALHDKYVALDRPATDAELEFFGGRWSDHCVHKTWTADILLSDDTRKDGFFQRVKEASKRYHEKAGVVSAFHDNAGAFAFYDGRAISIKGETHISPTGKEPKGGAATGVGGLQRDIVEMGTGPVIQIFGGEALVFASPNANIQHKPEGMHHPAHIAKGTIDGIVMYGNQTGIPEVLNSVTFMHDPNLFEYNAKPICLVIGGGETGVEDAVKGKPEVGDVLLLVGGPTGRDGIHGANASSVSAEAVEKAAFGSFVQNGNPIEQKTMHDLIQELGRRKLYHAANDLGASGISSAAGEMGEEIGVCIQLGNLPTKYEGLEAWEKFISESQERAVLAVPREHVELIKQLAEVYESEVTDIGLFDGSHRLTVYDGEELAIDLDYDFIVNGIPKRELLAHWTPPDISERKPHGVNSTRALYKVMAHGAVSSKELVSRQYDQTVQGHNVLPAYGGVNRDTPNDAAVVKVYPDKPYGAIFSNSLNPNLIRLDPYQGTLWACTDSVARNVAVGGDPDAMVYNENFMWPSPNKRNVGSQDLAVDAVNDFQHATEAPVISGKDSQSGSFIGKNGQLIENGPVVAWTTVSKVPDIIHTVSSDIKKPGSRLVFVGKQDAEAMGGSVLYDVEKGSSVQVPTVDLEGLMPTFRAMHSAIKSGAVLASHAVNRGGIAKAVSEMCFGGDCGSIIGLDEKSPASTENQLFNETPGCFVIEVSDNADLEELFGEIPHRVLGTTTESKTLEVTHNGNSVIAEHIWELREAWQRPMQEFYNE